MHHYLDTCYLPPPGEGLAFFTVGQSESIRGEPRRDREVKTWKKLLALLEVTSWGDYNRVNFSLANLFCWAGAKIFQKFDCKRFWAGMNIFGSPWSPPLPMVMHPMASFTWSRDLCGLCGPLGLLSMLYVKTLFRKC